MPLHDQSRFKSLFDALGKQAAPASYRPVTTFHPKLDLMNTNLAELHVAMKLGEACGEKPLWIPYPYDVAMISGEKRITSPVITQFEGESVRIVSPNRVGGIPINLAAPFSPADSRNFSSGLKGVFDRSVRFYRDQINELGMGHPLFHMKGRKPNKHIETSFSASLSSLTEAMNPATRHRSLSDQLADIDSRVAKMMLGVDVEVRPIDRILAEDEQLLDTILRSYHDMHERVGHTLKVLRPSGERPPVTSEGGKLLVDGQEISQDELAGLAREKKVAVNGELFFAVINHLGHGLTIGGRACESYYDTMFDKAAEISRVWNTPFNLRYALHDVNSNQDSLGLRETAAVLRVLDKVAARNLLVNGHFDSPLHVADHLAFLGGMSAVPEEFVAMVPPPAGDSALAKKERQAAGLSEALAKLAGPRISSQDISLVAQAFNIRSADQGYVRRMLEEQHELSQRQAGSIKADMALEQIYLGGTIDGLRQEGIVERSRRAPSAINLLLTERSVIMPELKVADASPHLRYCLGEIVAERQPTVSSSTFSHQDHNQVMQEFFQPRRLPFGMMGLK